MFIFTLAVPSCLLVGQPSDPILKFTLFVAVGWVVPAGDGMFASPVRIELGAEVDVLWSKCV